MKKVFPDAPDEVLLVLDGSTGQNAFEQARQFAAVTQVSSLAITKLDGTAKGGVVIGISDQLKNRIDTFFFCNCLIAVVLLIRCLTKPHLVTALCFNQNIFYNNVF